MKGRPKRRWGRALLWTLACIIVLAAVAAGGSYLWFRSQVAGANERVPPEVQSKLTAPPPSTVVSTLVPASPSVMNVLVLGSDRRADDDEDQDEETAGATKQYGLSDTIIVVHIDPGRDYLSVMSLPRDLRVTIPGYGRDKINAAYSTGGPALTLDTVEELTGIDINHYLEVDFEAFEDITDALGGVYLDVDRRYWNDDPHWEMLDIYPGYQLLNGEDALDYVRFRHDLNMDFGRMERQQRYLAAAREQAMSWDLPFKLPRIISALFDNITTDLSANEILELAYWGVRLDGGRIRQISLVSATETIDGISYVVAGKKTIADAVLDFLTPPSAAGDAAEAGTGSQQGTPPVTAGTDTSEETPATTGSGGREATIDFEVEVLNGSGRSGAAAAAAEWLEGLGAEITDVGNAKNMVDETEITYPKGKGSEAEALARLTGADSVGQSSSVKRVTLTVGPDFTIPEGVSASTGGDQPVVSAEDIPNADEWRALAWLIDFPVMGPSYLPEGYVYNDRMPQEGPTYDIDTGGGTKPAFKMIYRFEDNGRKTDQYMGITETTWTGAPAAAKGAEVKYDGITYTIVGTSEKVERVWWKKDGVLYWVSNTLSHLLSKEEMLAVARSMIPIPEPET